MFNKRKPSNLKDDYEDLKCSFCNKYLSVPPIFTSDDGKTNQCGRCKDYQSGGKSLLRNETYEKLAKHMQFPCSESKNCTAILDWGKVSDHENICPYRQMMCPHNGCWQMYEINTLLNHFRQNHQVYAEHIIEHNFQCQNLEPDVILIHTDNSNFLAYFTMDDDSLWFNVFSLTSPERKHKFTIGFTSTTCSVYFSEGHNISPYVGKYCTTSQPFTNLFKCIRRASLIDILKINESTSRLTIKLEILNTNQNQPTQSSQFNCYKSPGPSSSSSCENIILKALECPICFTEMTSNIYLCRTGHSICANCRQRTSNCPTCRGSFENGRNYALEGLYQKFKARPRTGFSPFGFR